MERQRKLLGYVDRGSILLVVYSAFSEGMVSGMWQQIGLSDIDVLLVVNAALLGAMPGLTTLAARKLGFHKIGNASCRGRVGQYVLHAVVALTLKNKTQTY